MKLYNRYLFQKTYTIFFGISAILISLIWFSKTISFVRFVTENGVELSKFFSLFILILPWLLLFIVPISLFIAILMTYSRLISNNEISVLKNSGLTKLQICKSALWIGFLASSFCLIISLYLMPYANKKLRLSRIDFKNNYASLFFNAKTFETINNLTIYTKERDSEDNLCGIMLYDERQSQHSITITAKKGHIKAENDSALLYMASGTIQKFNYTTKHSEILYFDDYVFNLSEHSGVTESMRWKAKERYLHELINPEDGVEEHDINQYRSELHQRFTYPLFSIVFALIAVASVTHGEFNRRGNMKNIVMSILLTATFMTLTISSYRLIERSGKMTPFLYANILIFVIISLSMLRDRLVATDEKKSRS